MLSTLASPSPKEMNATHVPGKSTAGAWRQHLRPYLEAAITTKVYNGTAENKCLSLALHSHFPPACHRHSLYVQIYHNWLPFDFDAFLRDPVAVELGAAPMVRVKMNALHVRSSVSQGNKCYARP